jgi:alpha-beta hydrolase superfamily lysophospholipase
MLNANGEPETSEAFEASTLWHRGFLRMTLRMEMEIAKVLEKVASQVDKPEQLLFTGHSAGGAIAQILYALSMQSDSALAKAVQGERIHWVNIRTRRYLRIYQGSQLFTVSRSPHLQSHSRP